DEPNGAGSLGTFIDFLAEGIDDGQREIGIEGSDVGVEEEVGLAEGGGIAWAAEDSSANQGVVGNRDRRRIDGRLAGRFGAVECVMDRQSGGFGGDLERNRICENAGGGIERDRRVGSCGNFGGSVSGWRREWQEPKSRQP